MFAISTAAVQAKAARAQEKKSLYTRLGGYDAIALVVDDFITRLVTDKRFERFFTGFSDDSKKRLRQHILDNSAQPRAVRASTLGAKCAWHTKVWALLSQTGTPQRNISWLHSTKVPEAEKNELLAFVVTQKKDIVEK